MLSEAIRSILSQTLRDFELIIVDDGSCGGAKGVVAQYLDPRIAFFKRRHGGPSLARNFGLSKAQGKYIGYLDDDDIYYPHHLKTLSALLDAHPRVGLVYGDVHFMRKGAIFGRSRLDYSKEMLEVDNIIPGNCSLLHRRKCLVKTGIFDEQLSFGEDWDMWLRISDAYKVSRVKNILAQVRFHESSLTSNSKMHVSSYMYVIMKRLAEKKAALRGDLSFEGYYLHIVYRLICKFRVKGEQCCEFVKRLVKLDQKNPEAWLALCICYLSYDNFDKAIGAGRNGLRLLGKAGLGKASAGRYALNINRALAYIFKNRDNKRMMYTCLENTISFIKRDPAKYNAKDNLTGLTIRLLGSKGVR